MGKFAINTVLWTRPFTAERFDLLEKLKDLGYSGVEFVIVDMRPRHLEKIRAQVDRLGLETFICGAFGPNNSLIDPDEKLRQEGIKYVMDLLKVCEAVGSRMIVGPTYGGGIHDHVLEQGGREAAEKLFVKSLKEIASEAEAQSVRIAIEVLNRFESNFLNLASDALRIIDQVGSPAIGLNLDPFHMNIEEPGFGGPIEEATDKLFHFHICENDRGVPGTGTINWDEIFTALTKIGYDGYLSVECLDPKALEPERRKRAALWRAHAESPDKIASDCIAFLQSKTN